MGCKSSKICIVNNSDDIIYDIINVKFVVLKKKSNEEINNSFNETILELTSEFDENNILPEKNISHEELNNILGKDIPRLNYENGLSYELLYCIESSCDIDKIIKQYEYKICYIYETKVLKSQFNSKYMPIHFYNKKEYFKLILHYNGL